MIARSKKTTAKSERSPTRKNTTPKKDRAGAQVRRPHKSFRLTRRSEYVRPLKLSSYRHAAVAPIMFMWQHKKTYGIFFVVHTFLALILTSVASQSVYQQLSLAAEIEGAEEGINMLGQAISLTAASVAGGLNEATASSNGAVAAVVGLIGWLVLIWLTRALLRGQRPRVRDGFYNAGTPLIPTLLLGLLLILQLVPAALAAVVVQSALSAGFITSGIEGLLVTAAAVLLVALSIYWTTVTLLSLVVVTLPGMYPLVAHKNAFLLISGRRLTFVLRWLWLGLIVLLAWFAILVPVILLERWLVLMAAFVAYIPIVPVIVILLGTFSLIYGAIYTYQLYREVVDHDA